MSDRRLHDRPPGGPAYEPMPPRRSPGRGRRVLAAFVVLLLCGLLAVGAGALWFQRQADPSGPKGKAISVVIPKGSSTQRIAAILDQKGVVESARTFSLYVRAKSAGPFLAGTYTMHRKDSFSDVVAALEKGPKLTFRRLTIPEGFTLRQVADRVGELPGRSAETFLQVAQSGVVRSRYQPEGSNDLEGLIFPDTYNVQDKDDERAILERMVTTFDTNAAQAGLDKVSQGRVVTPYQAIVVASLVEREAKREVDRGPVARVIYNRLKRRMLLQVDATLLYARGEHKNRVLDKDKEIDSPYNTYKRVGLPPTPIAAPGRSALAAAIDPPDGDFLYYVTVNDCTGETVFAATNAEHDRNVARRKAENPGQDKC